MIELYQEHQSLFNFFILVCAAVFCLAFAAFVWPDRKVNRRVSETTNKHWWSIVGLVAFIALYIIAGSIEH